MLEKILNKELTLEEVLTSNDARTIFYYAYFNKGNIEELSNAILETKNERYIHFFINHIEGIDKTKFLNFILSSTSVSYIYNCIYDNPEYLDYADLFIKRSIELNDDNYIWVALYYFHIVKQIKNDKVFEIEKEYFNISNEIELINLIMKNYDERNNRYKISNENYSNKCYEGHNGVVPFMIVCHITNSYNKALYNFYDDKSDVSSHFVISRSGEYKQVVSLDNSSWANGTSFNFDSDVYHYLSKNDLIKSIDMNANYFTFTIEHESFDGSLTELEYQRSLKIMKLIIKYLKDTYNYDFIVDRDHIIGHDEVNPIVRTMCPGEKFPFERFINDLKKEY